MSSNFKIAIPEPCNEDWNKMTPDKTGRFCLVCNKSVIDFTNKLPDEIQHFFNKNQDKKICGRFKNSQLDAVSIQIPSGVLFSQTQYHKIFLLALFVVMGSSLFSCATLNGDKQKIEKIQLREEVFLIEDTFSLGITIPSENFTEVKRSKSKNIKSPKTCKDFLAIFKKYSDDSKFTTEAYELDKNDYLTMMSLGKYEGKKMLFFSKSYSEYGVKKLYINKDYEEKNNIKDFTFETRPYFPNGIKHFYTFFANEFHKPENVEIKDFIEISMTVETDGSLTYIESPENIDEGLKNEIIRILKLSPKWKPGKSNCRNTNMIYAFGIIADL